jgi:hypothetical protein
VGLESVLKSLKLNNLGDTCATQYSITGELALLVGSGLFLERFTDAGQ